LPHLSNEFFLSFFDLFQFIPHSNHPIQKL
jgi:hypothetical protein